MDVAVEDRELARIAAQYGVDVPKSGGPRHSFSQKFAGRLPDDVGGYGKARLWEAFPGGLKPGADLIERINGFRFADESKDAKTPIAYQQIREILVKELK